MSTKRKHSLLAVENLHAVSAEVVRQTIAESDLQYSIDMGAYSVHHGTREGIQILIVEHHNQTADQLSAIWFNDGEQ